MSDKLAAAAGDEYHDNSYTTHGHGHGRGKTTGEKGSKSEPIEVIPDEEYVDGGMGSRSRSNLKGDLDAQLERDDVEAIDKSNIIKGDGNKTRSEHSHLGLYAEPGDEEGLPANDGTSSAR